jgi:hypothetical protein
MLHPNGFTAESFVPLNYEPDGKLVLSWCDRGLDDAPWELRLELVAPSHERWGYLSLIRLSSGKPMSLDVNVLAGHFRAALSKAVKRACDRMYPISDNARHVPETLSRTIAAGSNSD